MTFPVHICSYRPNYFPYPYENHHNRISLTISTSPPEKQMIYVVIFLEELSELINFAVINTVYEATNEDLLPTLSSQKAK